MFARRMVLLAFVLGLCLLSSMVWAGRAAPNGDWQPAGMLFASDGGFSQRFGGPIALQGDTAVIGSPGWGSPTAENVGAAYVFTHDGQSWVEQTRLTAPDGLASDRFGVGLILVGDTLVVSTVYGWRTNPGEPDALSTGTVYIFTGSGANWSLQTKLAPEDLVQYNSFGSSIDLEGDTLIAGAPNFDGTENEAAYIFERVNGVWGGPQKLTPPPGDTAPNFGSSVEIAGDIALVGMCSTIDYSPQNVPGVVYVFRRSSGAWQPAGTITSPESFAGDGFGCGIEYDGTMAIIRARHEGNSTRLPGYLYVFTRDGTTWTPAAAPPRDNTHEFELGGFGLFGDRLVLGTTEYPEAPFKGRFLIYRREGGSWVAEPPIIQPDDVQIDDAVNTGFGGPVALNEEHFLAGAPYHRTPDDVYDQGGVYVFRAPAGVTYTLFTPIVAAPGAD